MTDFQHDIAIVGAGFCGMALARTLAQCAPSGTRVALIGTAEDFGRGLAYAQAQPEHLLNVRARDMGIDPDDLAGFADWLKLEGDARTGFVPRRKYGDYLDAELDAVLVQFAEGFTLDRIPARVVDVRREGEGFTLSLNQGDTLQTKRLVLATGTLPPAPLMQADETLRHSPHYIESPWVSGALENIDADASVLIVGAGLTFADIAASLHVRGHRGRILAISRHGLEPQAQPAVPLPPFALPAQLQAAWGEGDLRGVLHQLRLAVRDVPDWRAVVDALRPGLQPFWKRLDASQRRRFLRHLASHWDVHRHRLAPGTAARLDALRASGQLRQYAARLVSAHLVSGQVVQARMQPRGKDVVWVEHVDVLIRATGLTLDLRNAMQTPFARMIADGLITADPHGLGLRTDAAGRALDAKGERVPSLSILGPLQRGQFWEITAVPELREAAKSLGQRLASELASELRA